MSKMNVCLYGSTLDGKTSLLQTFAFGLFEATGKKTRVYTAENYDPLKPGIHAGYIELWQVAKPTYPFERLRDIAKGEWPADLEHADADVPLLPALLDTRYVAQCVGCQKEVHNSDKLPPDFPRKPIICKACDRPVPLRRRRRINQENGIQNVGAVFFEGLVAFAEMLMDQMSKLSAEGTRIGEDVAVRFTDGAESVAGSSRSSYGIGQRRIKAAVEESRLLPVDYVIWTGLKQKGTDDERRVPVFGPKLVGSAATDDIPRWFGPTLALASVPPQGCWCVTRSSNLYHQIL